MPITKHRRSRQGAMKMSPRAGIITDQNTLDALEAAGLDGQYRTRAAKPISFFLSPAQKAAFESNDLASDITARVEDAVNSQYNLLVTPGRGLIVGPGIQVPNGVFIKGVGGAPYDTSLKHISGFVNTGEGGGIFRATGDVSPDTKSSFAVMNMRLVADNPIVMNDLTALIDDEHPMPYLMRPFIVNNYFQRRANGVGRASTLTKAFNGFIAHNTMEGFDEGLLLHACDICKVYNNRVQGSKSFSIRLQTAHTFGSQNEIRGNDLLHDGQAHDGGANIATLVHLKLNDSHTRVHDNYLECNGKNGKIKGFIDIGNHEAVALGTNVTNNNRTSWVVGNRIDGMQTATDWIYRLKTPSLKTFIHDSSTSGDIGTATMLHVVNDVHGNGILPLLYSNNQAACHYDFKLDHRAGPLANFSTYDNFDPFVTGLTPRNYPRAIGNSLQANAANAVVGTNGEAFVVSAAQPANVAVNLLAGLGGLKNPWFLQGRSYDMIIRAKTDNAGGDNVAFWALADGVTTQSTGVQALTTQYRDVVLPFNGMAAAVAPGFGIANTGTVPAVGKRQIQSIRWRDPQCAVVEITPAELLALNGTPKVVIPAPGANYAIVPTRVHMHKLGGGFAYVAPANDLVLKYSNAAGEHCSGVIRGSGFLTTVGAQNRTTGQSLGRLTGSAAYDPPALAAFVSATTTVTVPGAAVGDSATARFSADLNGVVLSAHVSAANTVTVRFLNATNGGSSIDLAAGTLTVEVLRQAGANTAPVANAPVVLHMLGGDVSVGDRSIFVKVWYDLVLPTYAAA